MIIKTILINILLLLNYTHKCNAITINALAISENGIRYSYESLKNEFKKYATENDLDIDLMIELHTNSNFTVLTSDFEQLIISLFKKKSTKYDIIFYDHIYTTKFGSYLENLKNYLPKNHIEMYESRILKITSFYGDQLVGLPITLDFTVLYSNPEYLNKYNKTVPKTWDELIETSSFIKDEEKDIELVNYNGLFAK
ncbi:hypothetical protein PIROE2DRAFT_18865 [Piromyces sp. E2]|nr:hypothetical protein PIROE2DRAFT_18865 [Piromyces sp. E2]|eukprot:OUM56508.1 hypothetical protein PIROE2DRAFT_18865 [Piromyces sp. E2]